MTVYLPDTDGYHGCHYKCVLCAKPTLSRYFSMRGEAAMQTPVMRDLLTGCGSPDVILGDWSADLFIMSLIQHMASPRGTSP